MTSRGIRNCNPGNIRHSKQVWQGEDDVQADPDFITFTSPVYGLRAMAKTLLTYELKGFNTVRKIIGRWAPPSENETEAYVADVAKQIGVNADVVIDLRNAGLMAKTLAAIIRHENGQQPYSADVLAQACALAGLETSHA